MGAYLGVHFVDEYLIYSDNNCLLLFFNSRRLHQNRKGSPLGGPFLFLLGVTAEPAPEGEGDRSEAEVCRATAETQTPAAST